MKRLIAFIYRRTSFALLVLLAVQVGVQLAVVVLSPTPALLGPLLGVWLQFGVIVKLALNPPRFEDGSVLVLLMKAVWGSLCWPWEIYRFYRQAKDMGA